MSKKQYKYFDPITNEVYTYNRRGVYKKNGRTLQFMSEAEVDDDDLMDHISEVAPKLLEQLEEEFGDIDDGT